MESTQMKPAELLEQVNTAIAAVLVGGQLIVEQVYSYAVPVSVFITVGGGVYFLYLLVARKKV